MYIVLGATGHVGSAVASHLLAREQRITVVTRNAAQSELLKRRGAEIALLDVRDVEKLRAVFQRGKRAFLLNPPAPPSSDTDTEERATVRCILAALEGSGLEGVVAESTYGAQAGERLGDLNVLFELEKALQAQKIPAAIIRAAYYMSNWDSAVKSATDNGFIETLYPAQINIPMVAPEDVGVIAAGILAKEGIAAETYYVEGPRGYSSADVAAALEEILGSPIELRVTPRDRWEQAWRTLGFSQAAAHSYSRMTAISVDGAYEHPVSPVRGQISLQHYLKEMIGRQTGGGKLG